MFLHTNLRQREQFLCTTTDLQQRAIRANTMKTPPTTDMSTPTKNTVLEPWQFSVTIRFTCQLVTHRQNCIGRWVVTYQNEIADVSDIDIDIEIEYTIVQAGARLLQMIYFGIRASHSMQTDRDGSDRQKQTRNREARISTYTYTWTYRFVVRARIRAASHHH